MKPEPTLADLPLRPELIGEEPYGAPQLDVAVCLNVNENPFAPSGEIAADMAAALTTAATGFNRYPDREATGLRTALAAYLGHGLSIGNIWAANGSNEVMTHILGAFGGPGQFGLMRVQDDGGPELRVEWSGRNHEDVELLRRMLEA